MRNALARIQIICNGHIGFIQTLYADIQIN